MDKPFPHEEDLSVKSARLAELNALLDMDRPENEIVDNDRCSEDDPVPTPCSGPVELASTGPVEKTFFGSTEKATAQIRMYPLY